MPVPAQGCPVSTPLPASMFGCEAIFVFGSLNRHNMQCFENVDVAAFVHDSYIGLADGDKLRMRHRKFAPIRSTNHKWPEASADLFAYFLNLHPGLCLGARPGSTHQL